MQIGVQLPYIWNWATRILAQDAETSVVLKRWFAFTMNGVYHTTKRVHIGRSDEYLIQCILRSCCDALT